MSNGSPRRRSLFAPLVLILFGVLFLLHQYRGLPIGRLFTHWWPLLLILWGLVKLYERTLGRREGDSPRPVVTAGEIFLVLGLLTLVGFVAGIDYFGPHLRGVRINGDVPFIGNAYNFDIDVPVKAVPANARISIRLGRGDIKVRAEDAPEIRVTGNKTAHAWSEKDAERIAQPATVQIAQNGDTYEVRVPGYESYDSRVTLELEIAVPRKATLIIHNEKGDIDVSDPGGEVSISTQGGDVEVRDAAGDVDIEIRKGDVKVSDVKGNVKISGKGGEVEVVNGAGGLTLDGEFYGPIRAEKLAKGVRFVSMRTDLTLTQLSGRLETGSGNLEIFDSTGNLTLRTHEYDINLDNVTGKIKIDNRGGPVHVRFSYPPKEDVEIINSSADIGLTLPLSSNFEILADAKASDISSEFNAASLKMTKTESGDSHLEGKIGSRGPKITLKTSYGSISVSKSS